MKEPTENLVRSIAELLLNRGEQLAVAESCTGGLLAAACTDIAGSSGWFERGLVTYSNAAKTELLDVAPALIDTCGAVSAEVVEAMLVGVLAHSTADWAIAISGVAGPDGGTQAKPVGTVYIGWAQRHGHLHAQHFHLPGNRAAVRQASVDEALQGLKTRLV